MADAFEVVHYVIVRANSHVLWTSVPSAVPTVSGRVRQAFLHIEILLLYWSEEECQREEYLMSTLWNMSNIRVAGLSTAKRSHDAYGKASWVTRRDLPS